MIIGKNSETEKDVITRADGRKEWICEHGVGHTIEVPEEHKDKSSWWSHGCDGCCNRGNKDD